MFLVLALLGCENDTSLTFKKEDEIIVNPGAIKGRVCDPSGRTWLADAMAYVNLVDEDGVIREVREAYSDADGRWELADLPGDSEYTFFVTYGATELDTQTVWVDSGETVEMPEPDCFDPLSLDVAVVTGDYDDFDVLLDQMGFANYELVDGKDPATLAAFLADPAELSRFDIVFFNGGFTEEDTVYNSEDEFDATCATAVQNLRDFVTAGGSVYASDWAYDVVELGWPERLDFIGADEIRNDAQLGDYEEVNAAISDTSMSEFLGKQYMSIDYDLPVWPPMEQTARSVSVHLTGSVPYSDGLNDYTLTSVPLLASFNDGDGKVVFSTFRVARNANQDMVNVLQYMMYSL